MQKKNSCENVEKPDGMLDSLRTQRKTWKMLRDREEIEVKIIHHIKVCALFSWPNKAFFFFLSMYILH